MSEPEIVEPRIIEIIPSEADEIREAQRILLESRKRFGMTYDADGFARAPLPAAMFEAPTAPRPRVERDRSLDLPRFEPPPAKPSECWKCKITPLERPGVCAECYAKQAATERSEAIRKAIDREIPTTFAWAKWGAREFQDFAPAASQAQQGAQRALASDRMFVVIVGPGRGQGGKSALGACWVRAELKAGNLGVRWVDARDLDATETGEDGGPLPWDRALHADKLLLDGLGEELFGAPLDGGIIAQRRVNAAKLIHERYKRRRRVVITTTIGSDVPLVRSPGGGLDTRPLREALKRCYGDDVAGRIYEHAAVVPVGLPIVANDAGRATGSGR